MLGGSPNPVEHEQKSLELVSSWQWHARPITASYFELITATLAGTRPTAVNLFWAIERMKLTFSKALKAGTARQDIGQILIDEAQAIYDEDIANNKRMGQFGAELLPQSGTILTHC